MKELNSELLTIVLTKILQCKGILSEVEVKNIVDLTSLSKFLLDAEVFTKEDFECVSNHYQKIAEKLGSYLSLSESDRLRVLREISEFVRTKK
jgi:hypothetical protein